MFKYIKKNTNISDTIIITNTTIKKLTNPIIKINITPYNEPIEKDMAIILCYFNPCKYNRIIQNMLTIKYLLDSANIPYFIGEIKHNDDRFFFEKKPNIFQYSSNSYLFYKENLINIIEKNIPNTFTKLCILDFDIFFDNPDWYSIISQNLVNDIKVLQPFIKAHFLNLDYTINQSKSNCLGSFNKLINYKLEHTGFAWAFDRKWFNDYNLDDKYISSSGDSILACNIVKIIDKSIGNHFYRTYTDYPPYTDTVKYNSCDLNIYHLNHGSIVNRQYVHINQILNDTFVKLNIRNINDVIIRRDDNILEWRPMYTKIFNNIMLKYFNARKDDV